MGGKVPLAGLKTNGTESRAIGNLASTLEEHTHFFFYSQTRQRKQTETAQDYDQFPTTASVHAPARAKHSFSPLYPAGELHARAKAAAV